MPPGNKPLPESTLTHVCHHMALLWVKLWYLHHRYLGDTTVYPWGIHTNSGTCTQFTQLLTTIDIVTLRNLRDVFCEKTWNWNTASVPYHKLPILYTLTSHTSEHCCALAISTKRSLSPWWPLLELQSWDAIIKSNHCNPFEDREPIDFHYVCPIFKWVTDLTTWQGARM